MLWGESAPLVLVPRLVGQTQASVDRRASGRAVVLWTVDRLKIAFEDIGGERGRRLREMLEWAVGEGCFVESRTRFPAFGLRGRGKERILSVFSSGGLYLFFEERRYPGGVEERDALVRELKSLGMLDPSVQPEEVVSGRSLSRNLEELDEADLERLLGILGRYCG